MEHHKKLLGSLDIISFQVIAIRQRRLLVCAGQPTTSQLRVTSRQCLIEGFLNTHAHYVFTNQEFSRVSSNHLYYPLGRNPGVKHLLYLDSLAHVQA